MLVGVLVNLVVLAALGIWSRSLLAFRETQLLQFFAALHDGRHGARRHGVAFRITFDQYHLGLTRLDQNFIALALLRLHHFKTFKLCVVDLLLKRAILFVICDENEAISFFAEALILIDTWRIFLGEIGTGDAFDLLESL